MPVIYKLSLEKVTNLRKAGTPLTEFLLTHEALVAIPEEGDSAAVNRPCFERDYKKRVLTPHYTGTAVAYQKGVLCGQSRDANQLYTEAGIYFGTTGLAVFTVPEKKSGLEESIKNVLGKT